MKLFIFHGPGVVSLQSRILDLKKGFSSDEVREFSAKDSSLGEVYNASSQSGLFSEKKLLVIEGFAEIDLDKFSTDDSLVVILKFTKTLPSNSVLLSRSKKYNPQVISFPEDKEQPIFPFLDKLSSKNPQALEELNSHLTEWGSQYILTMMAYSLRRFIQKNDRLPDFVLEKIERERKNFPLKRIKALYKQIIETDFKIKQGILDEKLATQVLAQSFLSD